MRAGPYDRILGQVIRTQRIAQGIALDDFAERLGYSMSAWSRIETGHTAINIVHLRKAARELDIAGWILVQRADDIARGLKVPV